MREVHAAIDGAALASIVGEPPAIVPMRLRRGDLALDLWSTISTLGTPQDVTLQELRMETFFPADDATDAALHALCPGS